MVQPIDFKQIQPIDFGNAGEYYPSEQREREEELQTRAGLEPSTNYTGVREQLASQIEEREMNDLVTASDFALRNGADAEFVTGFIQKYTPGLTKADLGASLETAAGYQQAEDAFGSNPITYQNNVIDGMDLGRSMAKQESYSSLVQRLRSAGQGKPIWKRAVEFGRVLIDPQIHQTRVEQGWLPEDLQQDKAWTSVGLGEVLNNHIKECFNNMNEAQFAAEMQRIGDSLIKDGRNSVMLNDIAEYLEHGGDSLIDAFSWFEVGSIGAGLAKKPIKALMKAGNIKKAAQEAVDVVAKGADKVTIVDDVLTPTAVKAVQNPTEISAAQAVSDEVGEVVADVTAKQYVEEKMLHGLYTPDEQKMITDIAKEEVLKSFNQTSIDPRDVMLTETPDGTLNLSMLIGTADGHAVDAKRAHTIAKRLGLGIDEWELVKKDGEGFFVQVTRDVTNTGKVFIQPGEKDITEWTVTGAGIFNSPLNWVVKHFGGSTKIGTEAHARAVQADRILQGILTDLNKNYKSSYNALDKENKIALNELFKEGQAGKGKWFTKDELDTKHLSEDIQKAYFNFKRVSDIEYYSHNSDVRKTLMRKGYRLFGDVIGKEEKISTASLDKAIVRDIDGNIVTDLSKYNDEDYVLVRVQRGHAIRTNADYTHIIAPRAQLIGKDLPEIVTHYMPGGRRMYTRGTRFVKIGSSYYNPVTGKTLNGFAKTIIAGTDTKQLQKYADELNSVIDIVKKVNGDDVQGALELSKLDLQEFKVDNWEQVKQLIKTKDNPTGFIDPNSNFKAQVLEHQQKYNFENSFDSILDDMSEIDTELQDLLDIRRNFQRARGNLLDDINGGSAKLVDIEEVFDKTINKAAYTMAKSELTHWYANQLQKYQSVIENWRDLKNLSDMEMLSRARVIEEGRGVLQESQRPLLRAAERFLGHARRVLNARTKWDTYLENTMMRTAEIVDARLPANWQRGKIYESIAKFNPAKLGRAIGFNYVMGWWNPAQLVKQGLGVLNVTALEPVNATKAMLLYPLVRLSRASKAEKGLFKFYKDTAMRLTGISSDDFDGLLKFIDRYGTESSSGLLVGADRVYAGALRADSTLLKRAADTQYIFMREGNAANFYIADIAAYLRKKGASTKEIAAYSDDLFLNMTKTSESAFQAGQFAPTTVAAQWMTYPARMIEAMFNGRLTKTQRLSLLSSQLALWGVGGTLLNDKNQLNMYTGLVDEEVNPVVADVITNGILGAIAHELGINFDEGIAVQEQLGNLVDIYDVTEGKFKMPSIPAAQAVPQAIALLGGIKELIAPKTGDYDMWRFAKYVATTKNLPSSIRNVAKGLLAFRFQKFYDNRGRTLTDEASTLQAAAQLIGFGPYEAKQTTYMFEALNNRDKTLEDCIAAIKPYADAINFYHVEGSEQQDVDKTLEKLYNEYNIVHKALRESLSDIYPDGDTLIQFDRQVTKLLFPQTTTVIDDKTIKTRKALGLAQTYVIKRSTKEILENGTNE